MIASLVNIVVRPTDHSLRTRLMSGAAGGFTFKILALGLGYLMALLITRTLGVDGLGLYTLAATVAGVLSIPAALGLNQLLVRETARSVTQQDWSRLRGLLRWTTRTGLILSIALATIAALVVWFTRNPADPQRTLTLLIALAALPFMVLASYKTATLTGLHHVVQAQFINVLGPPVIAFALLAVTAAFFRSHLTVPLVMIFSWLAFFSACVAGMLGARHALPLDLRDAEPAFFRRAWFRAALPMMLIGVVHIVNKRTDILMLGALMTDADVGVYSVACRYADLVTFPLLAANGALSPAIASVFAEGNMQRLQRIATKSARAILALSIPIAAGIIVFRTPLLKLFGDGASGGSTALIILTAVNAFCAASGSASLILAMTGHERDVAVWAGATALLNVVLNWFFIPRWGINGAAAATAITAVIRNSALMLRTYGRLKIITTAFGPLPPERADAEKDVQRGT